MTGNVGTIKIIKRNIVVNYLGGTGDGGCTEGDGVVQSSEYG